MIFKEQDKLNLRQRKRYKVSATKKYFADFLREKFFVTHSRASDIKKEKYFQILSAVV